MSSVNPMYLRSWYDPSNSEIRRSMLAGCLGRPLNWYFASVLVAFVFGFMSINVFLSMMYTSEPTTFVIS